MKHRLQHRLQHRLMAVFAAFTLGVSALFGLFAMAFVYTVEDRFLERLLAQEAAQQRAHHAQHGTWARTGSDFMQVHTDAATLPDGLAALLAREPRRREAAGRDGRHYHLMSLRTAGQAPWLVAEVSQQLIVRPMRQQLLGWLVTWGLAVVLLALLLAWWLARRISTPLERLAGRVAQVVPEQLPHQGPQHLAQGTRNDEVGAVAQGFDALLARTRDFIAREQAFTRDASHELRTPLSVLRMAIERLLAQPGLQPAVQQQLLPMRAATLLMEQTVNTLLLLAREEAAAVAEPVPVLPLVEQWVLAHADALDQQGMTLHLSVQRGDTMALPAPVLQLVIGSLLGNAYAHGLQGGQVQVSMDAGGLCITNPSAALPAGAGADFVKGEGSAGFGLGLAIVSRLLNRHGSRLDIGHEAGHTRVRVAHLALAESLRPLPASS